MNAMSPIAIIDDDASMKDALVGLLDSMGIDAQGYVSAEDFLEASGKTRFACIVTDLQMPGLDGIELLATLRARGDTVPVIVITAQSRPGLEDRALAAGALCLLRKPFEADALLACLARALPP